MAVTSQEQKIKVLILFVVLKKQNNFSKLVIYFVAVCIHTTKFNYIIYKIFTVSYTHLSDTKVLQLEFSVSLHSKYQIV